MEEYRGTHPVNVEPFDAPELPEHIKKAIFSPRTPRTPIRSSKMPQILANIMWSMLSIGLAFLAYKRLDIMGLIPHYSDVPVEIESLWNGEYTRCWLATDAITSNQYLSCYSTNRERVHVLQVIFWGRIDRTDKPSTSWKCQWKDGLLRCKALD